MSQRPATESTRGPHRRSVAAYLPSRPTARAWLSVAAFLLAAALTLVRVVRNAPVEAAGLASAPALLPPLVQVTAGLAIVVTGLSTDRPAARAALVFAGVFAVLATVDAAASVPATGALVGGGAAIVGTDAPRRWVVGGLVLGGVVASLAAGLGLAPATLRPLGTTLALVGLAATPLLVAPSRGAWVAGGLVAGGVLAAGHSAPFVTGAVTLVSTAAVGASLPLLAVGVGGATATGVGLLADGQRQAALGVGLLVLAGVPATVPRATLTLLGLATVLGVGGARR